MARRLILSDSVFLLSDQLFEQALRLSLGTIRLVSRKVE